MSDKPTVAVLGTGIMGLPMAANLAKAGLAVRAWNRTTEKARPLAEHGAKVCESAAQAIEGADIVVTMLADGPTIQSVLGENLDALGKNVLWLQTSTIGLEWTERFAEAARTAGIDFVDAPVLGT